MTDNQIEQIRTEVAEALETLSTDEQSRLDNAGQIASLRADDLSSDDIAGLVDHTLLKPEATEAQIRQLCDDARTYQFASVCVNPTWITLCCDLLAETDVKTCTVVGFPLGAMLPRTKMAEAQHVVELGAQEVDMVLSVGRLRDGDFASVYSDIAGVVTAAHARFAPVKVIFENGLLTDEEKVAACVICQHAGVDYVKTATGFAGGGATVDDVKLMRRVVGEELGVKAAGGVRSAADARAMINAGATRIGASSGVAIVKDLRGEATDASKIDASKEESSKGY